MKLLHDFFLIFLPLFVVIDPAGMLPVYLALTSRFNEEQRRRIALRASIVAACTGIIFIILGQAIFNFVGVRFEDFQIAGGLLLVVLTLMNLLGPRHADGDTNAAIEPEQSFGIVPLAVPLIVGPATLTTALLLVNTYGKIYGQVVVEIMVSVALLLNLLILYAAMHYSRVLVAMVGKNVMIVVNKIVMILLAAIAVSLIRQGVVSIVQELRHAP